MVYLSNLQALHHGGIDEGRWFGIPCDEVEDVEGLEVEDVLVAVHLLQGEGWHVFFRPRSEQKVHLGKSVPVVRKPNTTETKATEIVRKPERITAVGKINTALVRKPILDEVNRLYLLQATFRSDALAFIGRGRGGSSEAWAPHLDRKGRLRGDKLEMKILAPDSHEHRLHCGMIKRGLQAEIISRQLQTAALDTASHSQTILVGVR